jgi:hypothetical protein
MKGVIFNLVEDVVRRENGYDYWDDVIDASGVAGAYTSLGTYPDVELDHIARVVAEREGLTPDAVVRHVGHTGMQALALRYPELFVPDGLRSFLMSLNTVVHPEVRRLYPGAVIPGFDCRTPTDDVLELVYVSERGRCDLAEGLVAGAAEHYGVDVEVRQPECIRRGDPRCVIAVTFS